MKAIENTIERLKKEDDINNLEITMLRSKLSLAKAYLGIVDTRLHYAERRAYERGFEECKTLAM